MPTGLAAFTSPTFYPPPVINREQAQTRARTRERTYPGAFIRARNHTPKTNSAPTRQARSRSEMHRRTERKTSPAAKPRSVAPTGWRLGPLLRTRSLAARDGTSETTDTGPREHPSRGIRGGPDRIVRDREADGPQAPRGSVGRERRLAYRKSTGSVGIEPRQSGAGMVHLAPARGDPRKLRRESGSNGGYHGDYDDDDDDDDDHDDGDWESGGGGGGGDSSGEDGEAGDAGEWGQTAMRLAVPVRAWTRASVGAPTRSSGSRHEEGGEGEGQGGEGKSTRSRVDPTLRKRARAAARSPLDPGSRFYAWMTDPTLDLEEVHHRVDAMGGRSGRMASEAYNRVRKTALPWLFTSEHAAALTAPDPAPPALERETRRWSGGWPEGPAVGSVGGSRPQSRRHVRVSIPPPEGSPDESGADGGGRNHRRVDLPHRALLFKPTVAASCRVPPCRQSGSAGGGGVSDTGEGDGEVAPDRDGERYGNGGGIAHRVPLSGRAPAGPSGAGGAADAFATPAVPTLGGLASNPALTYLAGVYANKAARAVVDSCSASAARRNRSASGWKAILGTTPPLRPPSSSSASNGGVSQDDADVRCLSLARYVTGGKPHRILDRRIEAGLPAVRMDRWQETRDFLSDAMRPPLCRLWESLRLERELGSGVQGTVYLASVKGPGGVGMGLGLAGGGSGGAGGTGEEGGGGGGWAEPVGHQVAVKIDGPTEGRSPGDVEEEIRVAERVAGIVRSRLCPNFVLTYHACPQTLPTAGDDDDDGKVRLVSVIELSDGDLGRYASGLGGFDDAGVATMMAQTLMAIVALGAEGIVHGDLHPYNVLWDEIEPVMFAYSLGGMSHRVHTRGKLAKVADFGRAGATPDGGPKVLAPTVAWYDLRRFLRAMAVLAGGELNGRGEVVRPDMGLPPREGSYPAAAVPERGGHPLQHGASARREDARKRMGAGHAWREWAFAANDLASTRSTADGHAGVRRAVCDVMTMPSAMLALHGGSDHEGHDGPVFRFDLDAPLSRSAALGT